MSYHPSRTTVANQTVTGNQIVVGTQAVAGADTLQGDLAHTGTRLGFFGKAVAAITGVWTKVGAPTRVMAAITAVAPAATAATNITPFGYTTAAQADAIRAAVIALIGDVTTLQNNQAQLVTDLQTYGLLR